MKSIILVGYMCVGKTTIGKKLAKALGRTFYDLDWYIEERFHKRVSQIFADSGEAHFRDLERRMLHEVAAFEDIVLACGGGTPCFFDNMDYMNATGHTVYLKATPEVILRHLSMSRGKRPLLAGKSPDELESFVRAQLAEREPFYSQAQHTLNVSVLNQREKIDSLVEEAKNILSANPYK